MLAFWLEKNQHAFYYYVAQVIHRVFAVLDEGVDLQV